ncbi:MAG: adenosylcobinamide-phosphate synthase CbiB [Acidobacteriota bacterium]
MIALALAAALVLDAAIGDPPVAAHPVRLLGRLIAGLEKLLYRPGRGGLAPGILLAALAPALAVLAAVAPLAVLAASGAGPLVQALAAAAILAFTIAFRDLFDHARPIAEALEASDLEAAREAVQRIVGRDAGLLDSAGVARAAVESVAESLPDGAAGPLLGFTAGGALAAALGLGDPRALALALAGAVLFRAVNTLDSMVGYRSERYLYFGRASARFDDLLGLVPSRLSILFLTAAAASLRLDVREALATWRRDRGQHPSPNAAQCESFVAGALGLALGGPTAYRHGTMEKPWLGRGRKEATAADLRLACRLVRRAGLLLALACAGFLAAASALT